MTEGANPTPPPSPGPPPTESDTRPPEEREEEGEKYDGGDIPRVPAEPEEQNTEE